MDLTDAINRLSEMAGQNHKPEILTIPHENDEDSLIYLITRNAQGGMVIKEVSSDLEKFDEHPRFRAGTAHMGDLDSLIALTNRFKNENSALFGVRFGNNEVLKITAVIDYHDAVNNFERWEANAFHDMTKGLAEEKATGKPIPDLEIIGDDIPFGPDAQPRHCRHKVMHEFPLSDELKAWNEAKDTWLDAEAFAEFIEGNLPDVMAVPPFLLTKGGNDEQPSPAAPADPEHEADIKLKELATKLGGKLCGWDRLMQLTKGLRVNEKNTAKTFINRNTGESSIEFTSENMDEKGDKLDVPNMFLIAIPIFPGGDFYRIPVRLRYTIKGGPLRWRIEPYQLDRFIRHAFTEACEQAAEQTGLPLFFGQPEA